MPSYELIHGKISENETFFSETVVYQGTTVSEKMSQVLSNPLSSDAPENNDPTKV